MRAFAEWLYGTAPSVAVHSTVWLIRLLQATHLLTAGVVAGSGVMIALRAMGWHRADEPFEAVWQRFAPWLAWGLAVMVATGIAQTLGDPVREFTATSYWVKLVLLLGCVAGTLLARPHRAARVSGGRFFLRREGHRGGADLLLARHRAARPHDRLRPRDLGQPVAAHMSTQSILESIQGSALADWMRDTTPRCSSSRRRTCWRPSCCSARC